MRSFVRLVVYSRKQGCLADSAWFLIWAGKRVLLHNSTSGIANNICIVASNLLCGTDIQ